MKRTGVYAGRSSREAVKIGDEWTVHIPWSPDPKKRTVDGRYEGRDPDWMVVGGEPMKIYIYDKHGNPVARGPALIDANIDAPMGPVLHIRGQWRGTGRWWLSSGMEGLHT